MVNSRQTNIVVVDDENGLYGRHGDLQVMSGGPASGLRAPGPGGARQVRVPRAGREMLRPEGAETCTERGDRIADPPDFCAGALHRAHPGRVGDRQGADRQRHPPALAARRRAFPYQSGVRRVPCAPARLPLLCSWRKSPFRRSPGRLYTWSLRLLSAYSTSCQSKITGSIGHHLTHSRPSSPRPRRGASITFTRWAWSADSGSSSPRRLGAWQDRQWVS